MDDLLFNRQFLLTKESAFPIESWLKLPIADYTLFYHPNLDLTHSRLNGADIYLLGYAFDAENPSQGNKEILNALLSSSSNFEQVLKKSDNYTGQFVIIYQKETDLCLFNDACAQREVYYTTDFNSFGSQLSLLERVVQLEEHADQEAVEFYGSPVFNQKKVFVLGETNKQNVKHLLPNHYLNIAAKKTVRFFPAQGQQHKSLNDTAKEAARLLQGYLKAVASRYKIALPVTAGYDSRVLFGASLELDCEYFVFKHRKLNESHPDITIPKRLLPRFGKKLNIVSYQHEVAQELNEVHQKSIDFYRPDNTATIFNGYQNHFKEHMILNGNLSEITRNFFGNFKKVKGKDLAFMGRVEEYPYAVKAYEAWLKENSSAFQEHGYHLLDIFYWEDRMGNWAAKGKSEALLGAEFFSPFNSRKLITLLLSVDRKYRDAHFNQLFNQILFYLSPDLLKEPINPDPRTKSIKMMKKFGLYDLYRNFGLKQRLLKF